MSSYSNRATVGKAYEREIIITNIITALFSWLSVCSTAGQIKKSEEESYLMSCEIICKSNCSVHNSFIEKPLLIYILSVGAFAPQGQSWVVAIENLWARRPNNLISGLYTKTLPTPYLQCGAGTENTCFHKSCWEKQRDKIPQTHELQFRP